MADWISTNQRRIALIQKKAYRTISPEETEELGRLQHLASLRRVLVAPLPIKEMEDYLLKSQSAGEV